MTSHSNSKTLIQKLILYATGPLFGIATLIITNGGIQVNNSTITPLIWALIAYMAGEHIVRIYDDHDNMSVIESLNKKIDETALGFRKEISKQLKVSLIDSDDFEKKMENCLNDAFHVKNTFIGIKDITGVNTPRGDRIISSYKKVLSKENSSWEDLMGVGDLLDGRTELMLSNYGNDINGDYRPFVVSTHSPVMNFILIGPRGPKKSDVFFGWIQNSSTEVDMFHSRDERIIAMFENYFESLKGMPQNRVEQIKIDPSKKGTDISNQSPYHRIRGRWISISGSDKVTDKDVRTYSIIKFEYHGSWKVVGSVYNVDDSRVPKYSIESDMCILVGNTLYYTYRNMDQFGQFQSSGIGVYNIAKNRDLLRGYYVVRETNSHPLRAMKLADDFDRSTADIKNLIEEIIDRSKKV